MDICCAWEHLMNCIGTKGSIIRRLNDVYDASVGHKTYTESVVYNAIPMQIRSATSGDIKQYKLKYEEVIDTYIATVPCYVVIDNELDFIEFEGKRYEVISVIKSSLSHISSSIKAPYTITLKEYEP